MYPIWLTAVIEVLRGSQSFHGNNSFSNDTVAANSLGQSSSSLGVPSSLRSTPKSTWDQEPYNISRDTSVGEESSPAASVDGHVHWCFKCDDPIPIIQCNGFKRHMREHETGFYCMLLGPVVQTEDGPKCAFCDAPNPDSEHLSTHNIEPCASKPLTSRSYVRGYLLNNHLRAKHGIRDGSVLVNQWRSTVDRKYFACGFCGSCFGSLTEQLNHIDVAHYSISKEVYDWNSNMAIQGLLSQPGVHDRLQSILTRYPRLQESYLKWIPALAKDIQQILEMRELSEETADVLFPAVIDQIKYGRGGSAFAGPKMDSSHSMQTFQRQNRWPPLTFSSNQDSTHVHALPTTMPILQSQQRAWESSDLEHTDWEGIYGNPPLSQITSVTYKSSIGTTHHLSGQAAQTRFSPNGCDSFVQQQHSAYVPSIASAQVWGDRIGTSHLSRLDERSQGVSPNVAVNPRPREVAEAREYSAQAYERGFHSSLTTRTAPLSHNRPISPMDQSNSSFGPADHPILAVRPTGKDLMDQYGVDDKQHTRQNQKRTRRQRGPC